MKPRPSGRLTDKPVILRSLKKRLIYFPPLLVLAGALAMSSCKNDLETIRSLTYTDTLPLESARDIRVIYSESGKVQAVLTSPLMNKYEEEKSLMIFPDGFEVVFFDSIGSTKSTITARYGKIDENEQIMEARSNVVVVNREKDEQLDTEQLVWDQKKNIIYSNEFVKITTADEVIFGDGLVSDQDFSSYTIKNPTGEFKVDPDEI